MQAASVSRISSSGWPSRRFEMARAFRSSSWLTARLHFSPGCFANGLADIRGQLRSSDLVGPLTESEIAVLLSEATAADAAAVVERLRSHLGDGPERRAPTIFCWRGHTVSGLALLTSRS